MIYNQETGRCKLCNQETLWGDAPHKPDCSFLLFSQIVDDCQYSRAVSINIGSSKRREAIIRIFEFLCSLEDEIEYLSHEDYMGAQEATAAEHSQE